MVPRPVGGPPAGAQTPHCLLVLGRQFQRTGFPFSITRPSVLQASLATTSCVRGPRFALFVYAKYVLHPLDGNIQFPGEAAVLTREHPSAVRSHLE